MKNPYESGGSKYEIRMKVEEVSMKIRMKAEEVGMKIRMKY